MISLYSKIIIGYLYFTVGTYIALYSEQNHFVVTTACIAFLFYSFFSIGLIINWKMKPQKKYIINLNTIQKILFIASIVSIANNILSFSSYFTIEDLYKIISDPSLGYESRKLIERTAEISTNVSVLGIFFTLTNILKFIPFIFLALYHSKISKFYQAIAILSIITTLIVSYSFGAMINVASIFFVLLPVIIFKTSKKIKFLLVFIMLLFVVLLSYVLGNRYLPSENYSTINIIFVGIENIFFYIAHGYVGLSNTLQMPFEFTYGQTLTYGISKLLVRRLGIPSFFEDSYLVRAENVFGWDALSVWSTIFPWLASDTTFFLIPFIMFYFGYALRKFLIISFQYQNPFAFLIAGQLTIACFMFPANNYLCHSLSSISGLVISLILFKKNK